MTFQRRGAAVAVAVLLCAIPAATPAAAQNGATPTPAGARRAMSAADLWAMGRVDGLALSPDGTRVAYSVTRYDPRTFKGKADIWIVPVAGGNPVQLTSGAGGNSSPAWSPDGQTIAFVSTRGDKGAQVYLVPAAGGEPRAVTSEAEGVSGPLVWSRDGRKLLFASEVWPAGDPQAERLKALEASGSAGRVYDELMYRHWDGWEDGKRSHVFVLDVAAGTTKDLTPGPFDTPPIALEGFRDYDLSPDGTELAFTRNTDVPTAVGTGNDVWTVSLAGGEPKRMTQSKANDVAPQYSPDGRYLAWIGMTRPAFEADRAQLRVLDRRTGKQWSVTEGLDQSVDLFTWSADSKTLWFLSAEQLGHSVYHVPAAGGRIVRITTGTYDNALAVAPNARTLVVSRQSVAAPAELFALAADGKVMRQLTHVNDALLAQLALQPAEPFWFTGARGDRVQGFIVKPPAFDASKKYPVVFLVHGGPQGAWQDSWSYRWNPNMFSAPGYVAVLVNFHGSTGYGQAFTDEISGDWGGAPFEDLMKGLDNALATYPYLDSSRMAAAGASYGGFMTNWIEGHTDRFKAIITHDGVFNTLSEWGSTEELWFPEWEFKGTPWTSRETYEKWNPANFATSFHTPMLVIHGGLDYRVPLEQGLSAFTTLRRQGIPARLLYFPDEGHWVLKGKNAMVWWQTMYEWLATYLKPESQTLGGAR